MPTWGDEKHVLHSKLVIASSFVLHSDGNVLVGKQSLSATDTGGLIALA